MLNASLESRLLQLEKKSRMLTMLCAFLFAALAAVSVASLVPRVKAAEDARILRARGIILEDDQGRPRILLGAPFPSAPGRLRTDATGTTLVFLDEQGHDRFRVGEILPAVPGFHRIGSAYGVTILDTQGGERGGLGFLSNGKNVNRAVIALDRPYNPSVSADAWGAIVDDATGFAGNVFLYPPAGDHDQEALIIGTTAEKASITFKDRNDKDRAAFTLTSGEASFNLSDSSGKPGPNLLKAP